MQELNKCDVTSISSRHTIVIQFPEHTSLTKLINAKNMHWQIETIEKLSQRGDEYEEIKKAIQLQQQKPCRLCDKKVHTRWNCPRAKQKAQQRRLISSRNKRKDNQMGAYANHPPFHLLTDSLIPQQAFDLYECEFVPFYNR